MEGRPEERKAALLRERQSQLRGLVWLALVVLIFMLFRARPLHLFNPDWWRFWM